MEYLKVALEHFPNYQHFNTNYDITFSDELNASGSIMCFNPMQTSDGNTFFLGMWYHDRDRDTTSLRKRYYHLMFAWG